MLLFLPLYRRTISVTFLRLSSAVSHGANGQENIEMKPANYRPGSDSYAYENPWPKLNGSRLDWLFGDGWIHSKMK
ncbi:hypothetical protein WUBG_15309, partial [Wuchereria bancrofti]